MFIEVKLRAEQADIKKKKKTYRSTNTINYNKFLI